jgi:hypothetical protein
MTALPDTRIRPTTDDRRNKLHASQIPCRLVSYKASTMNAGSNAASSAESLPPRIYILLENPRKGNNLGPILRCANAFGITTVVAVGYEKCSVEGSHGASKNVEIIAYPTVEQAVAFLRGPECSCQSLVGLLGSLPDGYETDGYAVYEDEDESGLAQVRNVAASKTLKELPVRSFPVFTCPFSAGNACIVLSKKHRSGLPISLARHCDAFVHVPHTAIPHVDGAPPLLDTPSCLTITLHHLTTWAGYDERTFQGHKFEVTRPARDAVDSDGTSRLGKERAEVKRKLLQAADETMDEGGIGSMFGANDNLADY